MNKPTIFTKEQEDYICNRFKEGASGAEIARELGHPKYRVYEALKRSGFKPMDNFKLPSKGQPEEIKQKILEHYKISDIRNTAKHFGLSYGAVRKILAKKNALRLDNGQKKVSDEIAQEFAQLWHEGLSQSAIAKKYHVSQSVVGRTLWKLGIQTSKRLKVGEQHGLYKGGRTIDINGYVRILMPKDHKFYKEMALSTGYVLEHRLVMAEHLGRPLTKNESVHHIDGNKQNNSIENLQLRQKNHGVGVVMRCRCCGSTDVESVEL